MLYLYKHVDKMLDGVKILNGVKIMDGVKMLDCVKGELLVTNFQ